MTSDIIIQSISVNLLRMSQWYFLDPVANKRLCEVYLQQSKQLATKIDDLDNKSLLNQVELLSLDENAEQNQHLAERFLTLGVLLQSR